MSFGTFQSDPRRGPGALHAIMDSGHAVDGIPEQLVGDEQGEGYSLDKDGNLIIETFTP